MNCLICGTHNPEDYHICATCGIPRGQDDYEHLPEGWEVCLINGHRLEIIDTNYELACFQATVYTAHEQYITYRSAPFKGERWLDEYYAPPPMTDEEEQLYQALHERVLADGWHPTFTNIGTPTNRFWRCTS